MKTNSSGYILIAQGEYSDYQNTAFRVLKPFSLANTAEEFRSQWKQPNQWKSNPYPDEYIAWLSSNGFIEDAPEIQEIHVGAYSFDDSRDSWNKEVADVVFCPSNTET